MKCPKCGKEISPDDLFCRNCGERITPPDEGAATKPPFFTRLSRKQLFIAGGGVLALIIIIALLLTILPAGGKRKGATKPTGLGEELTVEKRKLGEEIGPNAVYGKVVAAQIGATRRGTITVKSLHTGKVYTFYVGRRTSYSPYRYPYTGEKVKVFYLHDRGFMKATQVQMQQ
ncbi:MAG: zinc ribbon domain-containing protein [Deltaproteobacteria bacterium]|nr:zinc ribbon domain-containing protein [Deltaproteobacteria bacterium]